MRHSFQIYKLRFTTPLHLGNEREDYAQSLQTIHSDTLYAALVASLAKAGMEIPEKGDLGCTISSLFPYYQKDKKSPAVYFLPKSKKIEILPEAENGFDWLGIQKNIKKIKWLDTTFFRKMIGGEDMKPFYKNFLQDAGTKEKLKNIKGIYMTGMDIPGEFITNQVFPRVKVPRQLSIDNKKQEAEPFYMERLFFKDFSGMYFMSLGDNELLEKGLEMLQHEGIGTDRNVGNGYFECYKDEMILDLPDHCNYAMNLSLFLPEKREQLESILDNNTAYSFKKRGGWVSTSPYNTIRKNRINMFEEGSVFKMEIKQPEMLGRIADLTPEILEKKNHKIWRNGKSIFVPVKL